MAYAKYDEATKTTPGPSTGASEDVGMIERAFLMGIGAAMLAKDRVQEFADELVSRGKMTRDEAGTLVNRMYAEADQANRTMQDTMSREMERVIDGMGLASAKDIAEIRDELTEIKAMIVSQRPMGNVEEDGTHGL
jgi:polyhydroxyalkanoate synthesis regulator phasin